VERVLFSIDDKDVVSTLVNRNEEGAEVEIADFLWASFVGGVEVVPLFPDPSDTEPMLG